MTATVEMAGLCKSYGAKEAVRGIDLTLQGGECIALVGHNGAGKSTLIKLMLGLIRPSGGSVRVLGGDPAGAHSARLRREIGFLPENVAFQPAMTGAEALDFYARLKGESLAGNPRLLERVGLGEASSRRIGTYSKGMRQRLGLAQALLGHPRLLLLDEPTTGLDPALRQHFYEIILELRAAGALVLLSSHALTELEERTDRVVVMNQGRMIACGTLMALRRLARLPVRLRFELDVAGAAALERDLGMPVNRCGANVFEATCEPADKIAILRRMVAFHPPLADIEVLVPSLDDIYAHFLRQEAAP